MNCILLISILLLSACGPHMTFLVHPKTGERMECKAGINQYGSPVGQDMRPNCVQQYESLGFISVSGSMMNFPRMPFAAGRSYPRRA